MTLHHTFSTSTGGRGLDGPEVASMLRRLASLVGDQDRPARLIRAEVFLIPENDTAKAFLTFEDPS